MGMLGWVMMGLAIWHFTIFLPDRFWGGIVGAFVGSLLGAIVVGLIIYGVKVSALEIPGEKATDIAVVLYAVPGALIGIALSTSRACAANAPASAAPVELALRGALGAVPSRPAAVASAAVPRPPLSRSPTCPRGRSVRARCERELGVSGPLAQVLVRRGLAEPARGARVPRRRRGASARARSPASSEAVEPILAHVAQRRADHGPRRLRRRRGLLDGGARARAARAGRRTSTGTCPTARATATG